MTGIVASNPLFLWMLPLAAAPVIFHLFFRIRKRPRPFSSLMFFHRIDPKLSARRRIREWLVLLLRALLIALLLLALARPVWLERGGGGAVSAVLVIDNSGSMSGAAEGGKSKLQSALEAAGVFISDLGSRDRAAIVLLASDVTVSLPGGLTSDKAALRSALGQITGTEAAGSPARAMGNALSILETGAAARLEIHLFSDLQENEWGRAPADIQAPRAGTALVVHRIPSHSKGECNVSVTGAFLPRRRLLAGRRFCVEMTLSNPTASDASVRLNSVDDLGAKSTQGVPVNAGETKTVRLSLRQDTPGFHWVNVWIEGDEFHPDNRAFLSFSCGERQSVIFVGRTDEFGTLPLALSPSGKGRSSGLVPVFTERKTLTEALSKRRAAMVVIPWPTLAALAGNGKAALRSFVGSGGNLLIVPCPDGPVPVRGIPRWAGAVPKKEESSAGGLPLLVFQRDESVWDDLRGEWDYPSLGRIKVLRFAALDLADQSSPLAGLEDGRVLLSQRRVGAGTIFSSGLAFEKGWSTLPLKGSFLAIVQSMALLREGIGADHVSLVAGQTIRAGSYNGPARVRSVTGSPLDWKGPGRNLPVLPRSGVYTVRCGDELIYAAVRSSGAEGRMRFADGPEVPVLGTLSHSVTAYSGVETFIKSVRRARSGLDLYLPLLLLAILAALIEGWIVNPPPRGARRRSRPAVTAAAQTNSFAALFLGALKWHAHLPPLACGALIAGLALWIHFVYRRMLTRMPRRRALMLIVPNVLALLLLLAAIFDPLWSLQRHRTVEGRILALLDTSSSMEVTDGGRRSRLERARDALDTLKDGLPRSVTVKTLTFDTQLHETQAKSDATEGMRGTDLGGALLALSKRRDISSLAGIVVLTDGGDERVQSARLPGVPLHIVGFGTDPSGWNDVALSDIHYSPSVEKEVDFEISADILARAGGRRDFTEGLSKVNVVLERKSAESWEKLAAKVVDLSNKRGRVRYRTSYKSTGLQQYRIRAENISGELSFLNNTRAFGIDVRKRSVHVLYFTRDLGSELKMLRNELAHDPGVALTALFRTIGERFTVQGKRQAGDEELEAGLPSSEAILKLYDCVIIGSFPSKFWRLEQMEAVLKYVEEGGAVVFLGGEKSFGLGGFAGTPLAPLFPWQIADVEPEILSGVFPVSIPLPLSDHPIVSGLTDLLAQVDQPAVESANVPGQLRPGATSLMNVGLAGRITSLVAVQPFGNGQTMAIATNTLWKWGRKSAALKGAYGVFWRQAVRHLAGDARGGRVLSVKWDKDLYRPGEQAFAEIRAAGQVTPRELRLSATVTTEGETRQLVVEPLEERPDAYSVAILFGRRGDYLFRLVAYRGEGILESYEKTFRAAALLEEGARLELDEKFLTDLAEGTSGTYVPEDETAHLVRDLTRRGLRKTIRSETSLVRAGPHFAIIFVIVLAAGWFMRRQMNLL